MLEELRVVIRAETAAFTSQMETVKKQIAETDALMRRVGTVNPFNTRAYGETQKYLNGLRSTFNKLQDEMKSSPGVANMTAKMDEFKKTIESAIMKNNELYQQSQRDNQEQTKKLRILNIDKTKKELQDVEEKIKSIYAELDNQKHRLDIGITDPMNFNQTQQKIVDLEAQLDILEPKARSLHASLQYGLNGLSSGKVNTTLALEKQKEALSQLSVKLEEAKTKLKQLMNEDFSSDATQTQIKEVARLQNAYNILFRQVASQSHALNPFSKWQSLSNVKTDISAKVDEIKDKVKSLATTLSSTLSQSLVGKAATQLKTDFPAMGERIKAELDKLKEQLAKYPLFEVIGSGVSKATQQITGKLSGAFSNISSFVSSAMSKIRDKISVVKDAFANTKIGSSIQDMGGIGNIASALGGSVFKVAEVGYNSLYKVISKVLTVGGKVGVAIGGGMSIAASSISYATQRLGAFYSKINPFKKIGESLGKVFHRLGRSIVNAFVFSTVYSFFNSLKQQVSAYLGVNKQLQSALANMRGAWLTAFQPIYDAVMPMLQKLISLLTTVGYKIAQFTSMIGGKTVQASQDAAKSLYEQANATDEAGAAAKRTIAPFDELNLLNDNSSSGANTENKVEFGEIPELTEYESWSDAFGQLLDNLIAKLPKFNELMASAADKINWFSANLLEMLTATGIQEKITTLSIGIAEAFNTLQNSIDWNQLGQSIGAGIQTALNFVVNFVRTFDFTALGSHIAEGINGVFTQIDFNMLGEFLVSKFNIIWQTVSGFVSTLDFAKIGTSIVETFYGVVQNIDLASVGTAISNAAKGVLTLANTVVQTIDWGQLPKLVFDKIASFITQIDIAGIITGVSELAARILTALLELFGGIFSSIGEYFQGKSEECGGNIILGILKGILDAIKGIATWVWDNICKPIWEGIKNGFGIASPSKLMMEVGENLILGLFEGIKQKWDIIISFFTEKIPVLAEKIKTGWETIKTKTAESWESISSTIKTKFETAKTNVVNTMNTLSTNMSQKWDAIKTTVSTKMTEISTDISTKWSTIKTTVSTKLSEISTDAANKWNTIKTNISTATTNIKTLLTSDWSTIKSQLATSMTNISTDMTNKWSTIKTNITTACSTIKTNVSSQFSTIKSTLSTAMSNISTDINGKWNTISTNMKNTASNISTSLQTTFTNMKNGISNIFVSLKTSIKTPLNGVISFMNSVISGVTTTINTVIKALNKINVDIPSWVPIYGGKKFGFNLQTISSYNVPYLAKGGVLTNPTLAMVGEYPGASHNPEIVAPQSIIQGIFNSGNDDVINANAQFTRQIIAALSEISMDVSIGDDVIAKAAKRGNDAYKMRTGSPLLV